MSSKICCVYLQYMCRYTQHIWGHVYCLNCLQYTEELSLVNTVDFFTLQNLPTGHFEWGKPCLKVHCIRSKHFVDFPPSVFKYFPKKNPLGKKMEKNSPWRKGNQPTPPFFFLLFSRFSSSPLNFYTFLLLGESSRNGSPISSVQSTKKDLAKKTKTK